MAIPVAMNPVSIDEIPLMVLVPFVTVTLCEMVVAAMRAAYVERETAPPLADNHPLGTVIAVVNFVSPEPQTEEPELPSSRKVPVGSTWRTERAGPIVKNEPSPEPPTKTPAFVRTAKRS